MKIMVLAPFEYNGKEIKPGLADASEAELQSLSQFGPVRPATSTEIQEFNAPESADIKPSTRENAARKR